MYIYFLFFLKRKVKRKVNVQFLNKNVQFLSIFTLIRI